VAMVKWDQLVINVCLTTRGQRARMPKVDIPIEELPNREVSLTKGQQIKW
jgi:hypothetical protein